MEYPYEYRISIRESHSSQYGMNQAKYARPVGSKFWLVRQLKFVLQKFLLINYLWGVWSNKTPSHLEPNWRLVPLGETCREESCSCVPCRSYTWKWAGSQNCYLERTRMGLFLLIYTMRCSKVAFSTAHRTELRVLAKNGMPTFHVHNYMNFRW